MTFKYAVTFESTTRPPLTIRGEVQAGSTQAGARLSAKDAMSRAPGQRWTSMVILLERPYTDEPNPTPPSDGAKIQKDEVRP